MITFPTPADNWILSPFISNIRFASRRRMPYGPAHASRRWKLRVKSSTGAGTHHPLRTIRESDHISPRQHHKAAVLTDDLMPEIVPVLATLGWPLRSLAAIVWVQSDSLDSRLSVTLANRTSTSGPPGLGRNPGDHTGQSAYRRSEAATSRRPAVQRAQRIAQEGTKQHLQPPGLRMAGSVYLRLMGGQSSRALSVFE